MSKTKGEKRVNIDFNVTSNDTVHALKKSAAEFINMCEALRGDSKDPEKHRAVSEAQTCMETACMYAVKSVFL